MKVKNLIKNPISYKFTCKMCKFYMDGIYCCGRKENQFAKVTDKTIACQYYKDKYGTDLIDK